MPTTVELVAGVIAIVLGVAWIVWPERMRRFQMKVFYLGLSEASEDQTASQALLGRVTGAILAVLGAVLVLDLLP